MDGVQVNPLLDQKEHGGFPFKLHQMANPGGDGVAINSLPRLLTTDTKTDAEPRPKLRGGSPEKARASPPPPHLPLPRALRVDLRGARGLPVPPVVDRLGGHSLEGALRDLLAASRLRPSADRVAGLSVSWLGVGRCKKQSPVFGW